MNYGHKCMSNKLIRCQRHRRENRKRRVREPVTVMTKDKLECSLASDSCLSPFSVFLSTGDREGGHWVGHGGAFWRRQPHSGAAWWKPLPPPLGEMLSQEVFLKEAPAPLSCTERDTSLVTLWRLPGGAPGRLRGKRKTARTSREFCLRAMEAGSYWSKNNNKPNKTVHFSPSRSIFQSAKKN